MKRYFFIGIMLLLTACKSKPREVIGENEFYVCSMDPQVMEKQMGLCPICKMPLAKVYIDKSELHLIRLSDEQIKLGNIKTDSVVIGQVWEERTLTGVFTINQNMQQQVSSRFSGRIDKLYFKIPGQEVKKGQVLYEVYSRDLMLAQEEYLFALDKGKLLQQGNNSLAESAKNKLVLWGMTEQQIAQLEKDKTAKIVNAIYSNASGTITEIPFKEGDYVTEGSTIFKLADLTSLWVEAQVYSNESALFGMGEKLEVVPESFPEEVMEGEIDFLNPELQPSSKINLIRVKIDNKRKQFIPGMMAYVLLKSKPKAAIVLPPDAVIQSGKISHVWIRNKDGSFEARKVMTGMQTKSRIEILGGLKTGDVVVTSGAYLIYSDYVFKRGMYPLSNDSIKGKDNMDGMKM